MVSNPDTSYTGEQIQAVIGVRLDVDPEYASREVLMNRLAKRMHTACLGRNVIAYRADTLDVGVGRKYRIAR